MEALGAAGVCIGDWVEQHRRVLGTRRVVGPGLVLQAATVRASDEQLTFDATTTFAHIRVAKVKTLKTKNKKKKKRDMRALDHSEETVAPGGGGGG